MIILSAVLATHILITAHKTIVCIGDSVTVNYGAVLKRELEASDITVNVIASNNFQFRKAELDKAVEAKPDFVMIGVGTDLSSQAEWSTTRDGFVSEIASVIARLRAAPSHPKIFLCLPPPANVAESDPRSQRLVAEIVPLLKQAARETNCATIDFEGALRDRLDLVKGLQPDDEGAEILADTVAETISTGQKADWKLVRTDSEESDEGPAKNAIDGDADTYWHTNYSTTQEHYPHELDVDTGSVRTMGGFSYLPRQDGVNGRVAKYEFYVSVDGKNWGSPVASGVFLKGSDATKVHFDKPVVGRYFRFRALSEQQGQIWASVAELDILKFYPKRQ